MDLSRKDFLLITVTFGTGLAADACGSSDSGGAHVQSCSSQISDNHGHVLAVAWADVEAGADKTYSIKGTATHDHQVLITASMFADLPAGHSAGVTSGPAPDGHTHDISVQCG